MSRRRLPPRRYRLRHRARFTLTLSVLGVALLAGVCYMALRTPSWPAVAGARGTTGGAGSTTRATVLDDWPLTLVNEAHPLPENFTVEVEDVGNQQSFDKRAAGDLRRMLDAAQIQDLHPMVCSGYRSVSRQSELYDEQVATEEKNGYGEVEAMAVAKTKVALPGASEHNLGLAADIVAEDYQQLDAGFEDTPECQWLVAHAAEYGFIQRYPKDKADITGIQYEPWHFRYVGQDAARDIMQAGVCLEEYLQK